uniref:Uncharacterized protein n=1 Tax=Romanomermis culicivorax TaxID=13658 RepID=A0A915KAD2_ROMCU
MNFRNSFPFNQRPRSSQNFSSNLKLEEVVITLSSSLESANWEFHHLEICSIGNCSHGNH